MQYTIKGFKDLLAKHDWTYEQSDDHRVWQAGQASYKKIEGYKMKLISQGEDIQELSNLVNDSARHYTN